MEALVQPAGEPQRGDRAGLQVAGVEDDEVGAVLGAAADDGEQPAVALFGAAAAGHEAVAFDLLVDM